MMQSLHHKSNDVFALYWCSNSSCEAHYTAEGPPFVVKLIPAAWQVGHGSGGIVLEDEVEDQPVTSDQHCRTICSSKIGGYPYYGAVHPPDEDGEFLALIHNSDAPNVSLPQQGAVHVHFCKSDVLRYYVLW